jgi:hypothetical protein
MPRNSLATFNTMRAFKIIIGSASATFRPGRDFSDGDERAHWTLEGLEKLILLGIWERRLDRRGNVLQKPPTVEEISRLPTAQPLA